MPRLIEAGWGGWLVQLDDQAGVHSLSRYLLHEREDGRLPARLEVVPGARTVLLDGTTLGTPADARQQARRSGAPPVPDDQPAGGAALSRTRLAELLRGWAAVAEQAAPADQLVRIPVRYDGADLAAVAESAGITPAQVGEAHAAADYQVAFCGFAAGFGYLTGGPAALRVPRLDAPRTSVPAGSVALAEEYTGIYPRRSPGGWRLIGSTELRVWDERADPPARLLPGTRVRFEPVAG